MSFRARPALSAFLIPQQNASQAAIFMDAWDAKEVEKEFQYR
jgi:hypothetical protein